MRVKGGTVTHRRRKAVLKQASGYFGSRHRLFRTANQAVMKANHYSYISRRLLKRDYRKLWITRINAACHKLEISYSKFMHGLSVAGINLNRKMLSEIAINDPKAFEGLVETSKKALAK
ncbi:MAG TPA: 50S ribosomal protein L20 [Firmicutes bacterium]|nr:50S ribosomal protein L20 [Bacillota bacterium]